MPKILAFELKSTMNGVILQLLCKQFILFFSFFHTVAEGEDSESEVEEILGFQQPPLIEQLKTILAEYPDDGQIIKVSRVSVFIYETPGQYTEKK